MALEADLAKLNIKDGSHPTSSNEVSDAKRSRTMTILGDKQSKDGNMAAALNFYYQAIACAPMALDRLDVLLARCHSQIANKSFDDALQDAKSILVLYSNYQMDLLSGNHALYGLDKFRNCLATFTKAAVLYMSAHQNSQGVKLAEQAWKTDLERIYRRLHEIVTGQYDFLTMLGEAEGTDWPRLDHATHIGFVEVRMCEDTSMGRGLFLTKDVKAGDLLFCEKAFGMVFVSENMANKISPQAIIDDLAWLCDARLKLDMSLLPAIVNLQGADKKWKIGQEKGAVCDWNQIKSIVQRNCFDAPLLSRDYHWAMTHEPQKIMNGAKSVGLWNIASFINHHCTGNIQRSHVGDMMIVQAARDLPAKSELKHRYVDVSSDVDERQELLKPYEFRCQCSVCRAQRNTSIEKKDKRWSLTLNFLKHCQLGDLRATTDYYALFDEIEATYPFPASEEPRLIVLPLIRSLLYSSHTLGGHYDVFLLAERMLGNLGFEWETSPTSFRITKWGKVLDFLVVTLACLWKALGSSGPAICADVEKLARDTHRMMVGDHTSFNSSYGKDPPVFTEFATLKSIFNEKVFRKEWQVNDSELLAMMQAVHAKTGGRATFSST